MDSRGTDKKDDQATAETPEDVAVLYSWANLHGAKYRDFSASRREYRAQLRHRAAEQVRQQALLAQAEAEAAATEAEDTARRAAEAARTTQSEQPTDASIQHSLREAEEAARTAAAERVEAARRAEAAAMAEAAARREEREIAEAHASAQRQAQRYKDSEFRRRAGDADSAVSPRIPGHMSDPYTTPLAYPSASIPAAPLLPQPPSRHESRQVELVSGPLPPASESTPSARPPARRPRGYRPDDASGVRQIYRGPDTDGPQIQHMSSSSTPVRPAFDAASRSVYPRLTPGRNETLPSPLGDRASEVRPVPGGSASLIEPLRPASDSIAPASSLFDSVRTAASPQSPRPLSPFSQAPVSPEYSRGRRVGDEFERSTPADPLRPATSDLPALNPPSRGDRPSDPAGPAWIYAPASTQPAPRPVAPPPPSQSSVADTLQHSRERVAARWYALKGVFDQPGQDEIEPVPQRQKEIRTPILAVFSLAGGVGKTSLVATLGRSLSSMGEKALLTDTTSHGLLPFYFGASELRQGTVRTFSPPSGSTDAPIYLVSYEVDPRADEDVQEKLIEEVVNNSRGTHRVLLDINVGTSWIIRRMARMNPTVLVPVAPDMNSVISLQGVEKFFSGLSDGDGRPLQPFYVLNQFDTSLPLHLDIREVMRRQLGDRLLPFVIRRAPAVAEALAEGMTIVDYSPDAPVSADYLNLATWLRTVAAPATAGFRNVRWSER